ncbi:uncharacterized protein BJ171DRAFT_634081 [Polychytrium aggregatum]|uniref:uncharacterized protein n=1 Tax=Polychytrium aggregatum TaxID=110093 RepID=UPI0022FEE09F|nr:uncharacterized protein BJ171DRAFT_634081 [Polychytrium aggregatum]KAI9208236.1 hypothetical protein BJ171DRAFT_634081 [Polychytrium aggregatum]
MLSHTVRIVVLILLCVASSIPLSLFFGWVLALALLVCKRKPIPSVPWVDSLLIGSTHVLGVLLMNKARPMVADGIYQIFKLAILGVVILLQYGFFGVSVSTKALVPLVAVTAGVAMITVDDTTSEGNGVNYGVAALCLTATAQVLLYRLPSMKKLSATEALAVVSPPAFVVALLVSLWMDIYPHSTNTVPGIHNPNFLDEFNHASRSMLFLSCALAPFANLASFGLIRYSGPIAYQVVEHLQTTLIFFIEGFLLFPSTQWGSLTILGYTLSILGIIQYSSLGIAKLPAALPIYKSEPSIPQACLEILVVGNEPAAEPETKKSP